eukprot:10108865-Prorocentrum_lima.AAC.1
MATRNPASSVHTLVSFSQMCSWRYTGSRSHSPTYSARRARCRDAIVRRMLAVRCRSANGRLRVPHR